MICRLPYPMRRAHQLVLGSRVKVILDGSSRARVKKSSVSSPHHRDSVDFFLKKKYV